MRLALVAVLAAGCYAPQPHAGAPCPDGVCPTGLVCSPASMTCETSAVDARGPDSTPPMEDAAIDARMIDAPPTNVPKLRQQMVNNVAQNDSVSATFAMVPLANDVVVMIGATPTGSLTAVTGGGATWTRATVSTIQANIEIWYGITNGSSSTVTINRTGSAATIWLSISEWTGLDTASTLVDAKSASDVTATADPGTVTTVGPTLLVLGATDFTPNTFGSPSPEVWTPLTPVMDNGVVQAEWYRIAPTAGTYGAQISDTQHTWEAGIAAFRYTP